MRPTEKETGIVGYFPGRRKLLYEILHASSYRLVFPLSFDISYDTEQSRIDGQEEFKI